jgi:sialate O-acetylesterase
MVLQRETPLTIRGWASPGEKITLSFKNNRWNTKASTDGLWTITLPPQQPGGPWEMTFTGKNTLKLKDVMVGDVWICSGQSNMVLPMERVKEKYPEDIAGANYQEIRHFFIPTLTNLAQPQEDLPSGSWKSATPENVLNFSAVAYFFARRVYEKYHVPVGLVNASVGGTPIEAWLSEEGLKDFPELLGTVAINKEKSKNPGREISVPMNNRNDGTPADKGLSQSSKWFENEYIPEGWKPYTVPGYWEDQGVRDLNGIVWFRKEFDIPVSMTGVPARLFLGRIVDADIVYVNGKQVGNTTYQYPPRRYTLPAGILIPGKNTLVVRVINNAGKGGFVPDKPYFLESGGQKINLSGDWIYKVGAVYTPGPINLIASAQNQPAALYNAMIAPLTGYRAKGFLWYQGETNTGNPGAYRKLLPALISDWRTKWNQGTLPFLFVQLANFMEVNHLPEESSWAELRDAQFSALSVPNTAMAVTIDSGEWNDIHPLNKKLVGERLAIAALRLAYGDQTVVYSGPVYRSFEVSGDSVILKFDQTGSGLVPSDGEPLNRFEIAGTDGKYRIADAHISGDKVVVRNKSIPHPEHVRYAWADNPEGANLHNVEGLPASPFRTFNPDSADTKAWNGKTCCVVLTYDDGLNVHLDNAIPLLDSLGMKGTFYIPAAHEVFRARAEDWKRAASNGHELGNHTLFHPCNGALPGRSWVNPDYDLQNYSVQRFMDEVKTCNLLLSGIDGLKERSFAYTCGDINAGNDSFKALIGKEFTAARGVRSALNNIQTVDLSNIDSYMINGENGEYLISLVKKAMDGHALLVFLFHGVGGEHNLNVSLPAHRELLQFLKKQEDKIWVTTLLDAGKHISRYRIKNE